MSKRVWYLPLPEAFSFDECLWMLDRSLDDCLHRIKGRKIIKAMDLYDRQVLISVTEEAGRLQVSMLQGNADPAIQKDITTYVKEWLDVDRDILPFYNLLGNHEVLAYMAGDFAGLRLIGIPDLFEALCWAITGQQINLPFAYKLKRRLVGQYGAQLEHDHTVYHIFPTPEALSVAAVGDLRAMQFSTQKAQYLINTATAFVKGTVSKQQLMRLPDLAARQQALLGMKGVGIWTANYVLMKSLSEQGSVPYGDAGINNALIRHGIIKDKTDTPAIQDLFARFRGWESYLVAYLWRSLSVR